MKTNLLVCLLLSIPQIGTVRHPVPLSRTQLRASSGEQFARRQSLLSLLAQSRALFRSGIFREAAVRALRGSQEALSAGDYEIRPRFLNNLGGSYFALHQYREALEVYLEARTLAESARDFSQAGKLDFNISSLYLQLGQIDAAVESAERAMSRLSDRERTVQLPKLLIHLATLRAKQDRLTEALDLFRRGIEAAERYGDLDMYTLGWSDVGEEFLKRGKLADAEHALLEAYRVRRLNHLQGLENSYRNLGLLRLEQEDLRGAASLLDEAVNLSNRHGSATTAWEIYYARGRVHLAENRLAEALKDLRIAARLARVWRRAAPADDASRVSAENSIQKVHSALIQAGNRLYFENGDRSLARETFEAAEANRAASLRALMAEPRGQRRPLPPAYWETLRRLESAQIKSLRTRDCSAAEEVQRLQGTLVEFESQAGSSLDLELPGLLERTRARLNADTVFLSFHLAEPESYLWAVSRDRFALYRLPSAPEIRQEVRRFTEAVRNGDPDFAVAGYRLYGRLFGPLSLALRRKHHWLLALDSHLFELPVAAIPEKITPGGPVFVTERHSVQIASGAGMLEPPARNGMASGPFLAIADPIYNAADPRWQESADFAPEPALLTFLDLFAAPAAIVRDTNNLHLARLSRSAREAAACAAAWGGSQPPLILAGASACRGKLKAAMASHPSVLHFATHVLHPERPYRSGVIALSLTPDGQNEILSPAEIATWHLDGTIVALSGCSSGSAEALPGTGLTGLTRAWQAAGAAAVVASLWPTRDDAGALFLSFYNRLHSNRRAGAAVALQLAQLEMIRQHTWRSAPRYWGAYFVTGNQQ